MLLNLGRLEHSMYESLSGNISDIPGLEHRVDNPLEFIGLFRTMHNACQRQNIPAKRVIFIYHVINL
jgi:Zyg-11 family protein